MVLLKFVSKLYVSSQFLIPPVHLILAERLSSLTQLLPKDLRVNCHPMAVSLAGLLLAAGTPLPTVAVEFCQMSTCTIAGTDGDDYLVGTSGTDVICGVAGNDVLLGLAGDDLLCGGAGDDVLLGGTGINILNAGAGNDTVYAQGPDDTVFSEQGVNAVHVWYDSTTVISRHASDDQVDPANSDPADSLPVTGPAGDIPRFTVSDNALFAPDGSPFTVRGINIFPWHVSPRDINGIVDCWAFNTVRLHGWILAKQTSQWKDHIIFVDQPLLFDPLQTQYRTYNISPLIEAYTRRGMVVIVDIHDMIGGYFQGDDLVQYLTFIEDFAKRFKDNPYVWLDLHNEPGNWEGRLGDFSEWRSETLAAINTVRAVAPDMPLLVSGTAWGQDTGPRWNTSLINPSESALLSNLDIINAYSDIIMTFHMYDQWTFGADRLHDFIDRLLAGTQSPIIVGDYGSNNGNSTISASRLLHNRVQQPGYDAIGRIAWTWSAWDANDLVNEGDGSGFRIDNCLTPGNLTELGQLIWDDNH